jgi:diguanylate cyclase (GGDEF)-like protein
MIRGLSLRALFAAVNLIVLFLAMAISTVYTIYDRNHHIEEQSMANIQRTGGLLQELAEFNINRYTIQPLESRISTLSTYPDYRLISVIKPDGTVFLANRREWMGLPAANVLQAIGLSSDRDLQGNRPAVYISDHHLVVYVSPVRWPGSSEFRFGHVLLVYDMARLRRNILSEIIVSDLVFFVLFFSALAVVFYFLNRRVIERLQSLIQLMQAFEKGEAVLNRPVTGRDEIAVLSRSFLRMAARIHDLLNIDYLTGVLNRRAFEAGAQERIQNSSATSLLFIDIDDFKDINDIFGHEVGDRILKSLGLRLRSFCAGRGMVGRVGGDEFLVLLDHSEGSDPLHDIETLHRQLSEPYDNDSFDLVLNTTIGVVFIGKHTDLNALLRDADFALYHGKRQGKNRVIVIDESLRNASSRHNQLTLNIKKALQNREFYLAYQPIFHWNQSRMESAEILLRWRSQELGQVSPAEFIPVLEETGLIKETGAWVLEEACKVLRYWKERGADGTGLNVNISLQQLTGGNLAGELSRMISDYQIDPGLLKLEITETEAMRDPDTMIPSLQELKQIGLRLAMDDFGTGYSSLSRLKLMPLDYLKIDRSFICDLPDNTGDTVLVKSMIDIAHSFGFAVVAEGVETARQLEFLASLQCDEYQGYYFSPPVSREELEEMIWKDAQGF